MARKTALARRRDAEAESPIELFNEVQRAARSIEDSIRLASYFRVFGLKLQFLRDTAKTLGFKFTMEHDGEWAVGFTPKRGSGKRRIMVTDDKLDNAVDGLVEAVKGAFGEKVKG